MEHEREMLGIALLLFLKLRVKFDNFEPSEATNLMQPTEWSQPSAAHILDPQNNEEVKELLF